MHFLNSSIIVYLTGIVHWKCPAGFCDIHFTAITCLKRNSKCLLRAVSNKEKQLHCRYECVYHNLICFLYLNDTLSITKLHSFGEWEWEVTNLRMKLLKSILWHFLGICLRNIQELQNESVEMELQTKFESKTYQILVRIKVSKQYTSFADITLFIFKFKKGKNTFKCVIPVVVYE